MGAGSLAEVFTLGVESGWVENSPAIAYAGEFQSFDCVDQFLVNYISNSSIFDNMHSMGS